MRKEDGTGDEILPRVWKEGVKMKKGFAGILSGCVLILYISIIMYVFFAILQIETLANFESAMAFEIIGFLLLAYLIMGNLLSKRIKTGFFAPLIIGTVVYTVILDAINIAFVTVMPHIFFVLLNFVLLFICCLISMPMYIMGRR